MRLRAFSLLFVSLLLSCLIVFFAGSIDASAALTGGRFMTRSEAIQVFGSAISGKYFYNDHYIDITYTLVPYNFPISSVSSTNTYETVVTGRECLAYVATDVYPYPSIDYITFDISPLYSIFDTTQIHTFIGLNGGGGISSTYQSPSWDWVCNGANMHLENSDTNSSGYKANFRAESNDFTFVPFDFRSQSSFSAYSYRACFYGNSSNNNAQSFLVIGLPYVDDSASGSQGTFATSAGGGSSSGDINVNIDLTETNEELQTQTGIISSILGWLGDFFSDLGDTVVSWVVPSQNFFENWVEEIKEDITDHFVPHLPLNGQLENIASDLALALGQGGVSSVQFPAISVPGTGFSLPAYSVPLVPSGFEDFVEYVKVMIDCLCTVWVFNMVLNRIHALIVGETSVEVINSAD